MQFGVRSASEALLMSRPQRLIANLHNVIARLCPNSKRRPLRARLLDDRLAFRATLVAERFDRARDISV